MKCLGCDNRDRFFDTVLDVLLIWGCQLKNPSSMLNGKVSVLMNLLNVTVFETHIKDKWRQRQTETEN